MANANYLVEHAVQQVWCAPSQDKQAIIRPTRITPPDGTWNDVTVMWRKYDLPNRTETFHVFQIGQIYFSKLNILPISNSWVNLAECCGKESLVVELYSTSGIRLPLHRCFYRMTEDRDLVLAVPNITMLNAHFGREDLYFRVYSNAYFQSDRSDPNNDYIAVEGTTPKNLGELITFQRKVIDYQQLPGYTQLFVNGMLVSSIDPFTARPGDVLELLYDSSVESYVDIKIGDMEAFHSSLDNVRKYLVHPPIVAGEEKIIRYFDDNSHYLYKKDPAGRFKGIYYHLNMETALRMVTHRDYAIQVSNVVALNNSVSDWIDPEELYFRTYIRKSGFDRALTFEANKLHELYKLTDADIIKAMVGIDSTVPVWRAEALEASSYPKVMGSITRDMTVPLVQDMYGYNAISVLMGNTPEHVYLKSGQRVIDVPYALQTRAAAFEYDVDGAFLGYHQHLLNDIYVCQELGSQLVELMSGTISNGFDEYYTNSVALDPVLTYRFYMISLDHGAEVGDWKDVTGSTWYAVINGLAIWNVDLTKYKTMVRSDKNIIAYKFDRLAFNGPIEFSLQQTQVEGGFSVTYPMKVPPGELDIFMNGRELAENLDYFVVFPKVVLCNHAYMNDPLDEVQHIVVRAKGFCKKDLTRELNIDTGFIQYGQLSRNNKFDLRDDRVMRIVVGGYLYARDELQYFEEYSSVQVGMPMNGAPYTIRDIVVPTQGQTTIDAYALRDKANIVNDSVSNYMTLKVPEYKPVDQFTIPERYFIFSPFCCRLIYDLKSNGISNVRIKEQLTSTLLDELCQPYLYLLDFDPVSDKNAQDNNFVYVQPHNLQTVIDVDIYQYRFISEAVKEYLNDRVSLSGFLKISSSAP